MPLTRSRPGFSGKFWQNNGVMSTSFVNRFCPGPVSRRSFLQIGGFSAAGLGLSDLLRYEAFGATGGETHVKNDKSVIFIWLPGGMPHMETYDMKPDAPAVSSIVKRVLGNTGNGMPTSVAAVDRGRHGIDTFAFGPAWLGASQSPFIVAGDPSAADFKVDNIGVKQEMETRLDDRLAMLHGMDRLRRDLDKSGVMEAMDSFNVQAMDMLTSAQVRDAFDLSKESEEVRDRYGRHAYGQRGLLARRLVEAGTRFVTLVWENPEPGKPIPSNCAYNWDSHAVNCHIFEDCKWRMPRYDQALTALIEDIYARGLDEKVMIVVASDFGHTPKINTQRGNQSKVMQPGRDHWPKAMSVLVSGGGAPMGQIIGATNAKGEEPVERILSPNDLWATVYRHLGIDYNTYLKNLEGLPMQILPFGKPIEELVS